MNALARTFARSWRAPAATTAILCSKIRATPGPIHSAPCPKPGAVPSSIPLRGVQLDFTWTFDFQNGYMLRYEMFEQDTSIRPFALGT